MRGHSLHPVPDMRAVRRIAEDAAFPRAHKSIRLGKCVGLLRELPRLPRARARIEIELAEHVHEFRRGEPVVRVPLVGLLEPEAAEFGGGGRVLIWTGATTLESRFRHERLPAIPLNRHSHRHAPQSVQTSRSCPESSPGRSIGSMCAPHLGHSGHPSVQSASFGLNGVLILFIIF